MRLSLFASGALLVLATVGCGTSPEEVCTQMVDQMCERAFECRTDKETPEFQSLYGLNVDACKSKFYLANGCADVTEEQNCARLNAGSGDFNGGEFDECQDALAQLSCQAYLDQQSNPTLAPAVCRQVCE